MSKGTLFYTNHSENNLCRYPNFPKKDRRIIFQCLNAVLKGKFLENGYEARLGIEEDEAADYQLLKFLNTI